MVSCILRVSCRNKASGTSIIVSVSFCRTVCRTVFLSAVHTFWRLISFSILTILGSMSDHLTMIALFNIEPIKNLVSSISKVNRTGLLLKQNLIDGWVVRIWFYFLQLFLYSFNNSIIFHIKFFHEFFYRFATKAQINI